MRTKVELHREVVGYLRHCCNNEERQEFYRRLEKVREDPIENSQETADPEVSPYILRFFEFGRNIAIFEYNPAKDRIIVRQCRKLRPRPKHRGKPPGSGGDV